MVKRLLLVAIPAILLSSCSSMTVLRTQEMQRISDESKTAITQQMQGEIKALRTQLDSLRAENSKQQSRWNAEMKALEQKVGESVDQGQVRHEELLYRLDAILAKSGTVNTMRKPAPVDTTERVSGGADPDTTPATPTPVDTAKPVADATPVNPELQGIYETARADFQRAEYKLAYDGFKQVYEKSKVGPMAENALYWMAQCLGETGQIEKSMVVYQRILEMFPAGSKTCVVLFKLADNSALNGKKEEQARYLEALAAKSQCQDTNEALKALETLDTLRGSK